MEQTSLIGIFLTGLLTGGLTCMAVQGGLLASAVAQREAERVKREALRVGNALPLISFLFAKLIAYTVLGALLGWLGSLFELSLQTRIILQIAVVVFMVGTAFNLLNTHPIFRYFVIQPPRFLTRFIRKTSKSDDVFTPAFLGGLTVFIPCGTTQAMMALAIASSSPLLGALILFIYTLGTSPIFFVLGYFATKLEGVFKARMLRVTAYALLLLAFFNLNNTIALTGSSWTIENALNNLNCTISFCSSNQAVLAMAAPVSETTLTIGPGGYTPDNFSVKAGERVTVRLVNNGGGGCASAFTIPSLGIQKIVPIGGSENITFTAPSERGELAFMCSMGMYRGRIQVI